jgi:hypothetical protein
LAYRVYRERGFCRRCREECWKMVIAATFATQ